MNYPLSNNGIDDKYAGHISKLYLLYEYCCACSKNHANKSQIYLTSSISLVGNVDNIENNVNSSPIDNPSVMIMVKLTGCKEKHWLLEIFFVVFISSHSTKTDG